MITEKTVQRALYLKKYSLAEYQELAKIRNGVEGIPSILRRRYNVDHMPVRGYLRSKMSFAFKVAAINVKRVLKKAKQGCLLPNFGEKLQDFRENLSSLQQPIRLCA